MSTTEARDALKEVATIAQGHILAAFEHLAREVAREEIAQLSRAPVGEDEQCTCHPDDKPPVPCARRYAYSECVAAPTTPAKDTGEDRDAVYGVPLPAGAGRFALATRSDLLATIADLEARLAEALDSRKKWNERAATAEIERDEARSSLAQTEGALREQVEGRAHWNKRAIAAESSLETAERRIGEAHELIRRVFAWTTAAREGIKTDQDPEFSLRNILQFEEACRQFLALTPDAGTARSEDEEGE